MKYAGMPMGMWVLFGGSFRKHLSSVYGYDPETAKAKHIQKTEKCHDQKRADQKRL